MNKLWKILLIGLPIKVLPGLVNRLGARETFGVKP